MSFANYYFNRFNSDKPLIKENPPKDLALICVIPVYNESALSGTLQSIIETNQPRQSAEIIAVVNQAENAPETVSRQNEETYREALEYKEKFNGKLQLHVLFYRDFPKKHAGVGLARKKGMDEALHRFNALNKPEGIICCTDADCTLENNFFNALESHFANHPNTQGVSVHFEHRLNDKELSSEDRKRIISYELHLRYYNQALRYIKFPFAFQTIGSSFAVRAESYARQGGMNKKKAGEDFYFLQKIIESGGFYDLTNTGVYPSARSSDRVPFGTGAAVKKMQEDNSCAYSTYALESFFEIQKFLDRRLELYKGELIITNFGECTAAFLEQEKFAKDLEQIKRISKTPKMFEKHFYSKFNAFKMVKYLNFAQRYFYPAQNTYSAAQRLFAHLQPDEDINTEEKLLAAYRKYAKNNPQKR
jgi:glycosyltransferase involved in cell wall biosynthesis